MRTCLTCALAEKESNDRPAACLSRTGPMRGWYVEPHMLCSEWKPAVVRMQPPAAVN